MFHPSKKGEFERILVTGGYSYIIVLEISGDILGTNLFSRPRYFLNPMLYMNVSIIPKRNTFKEGKDKTKYLGMILFEELRCITRVESESLEVEIFFHSIFLEPTKVELEELENNIKEKIKNPSNEQIEVEVEGWVQDLVHSRTQNTKLFSITETY